MRGPRVRGVFSGVRVEREWCGGHRRRLPPELAEVMRRRRGCCVRALATASRRCAAPRSLPVKAPHRIRGDFDAGQREEFADHAERGAFLPQFSDAFAVGQ